MYPYIYFFGAKLQSYHICAALAGIAGAELSVWYLRKEKQGVWAFFLPLFTAVAALIGARLLNFITNPRAYISDFRLWTFSYQKLSLMGGLIAGTAVIILYCIFRKESLPALADAFTVPAASGIVLLKTGCFLNGCCFGKPANGPFGVVFPANAGKYAFFGSMKVLSAKSPVVHPTQVYEIAGAVTAVVLAVMLPKLLKLGKGSRAAIFAALFSLARWVILPLRELPYDRKMITVFYPLLYALLIFISVVYFIAINIKKEQSDGI